MVIDELSPHAALRHAYAAARAAGTGRHRDVATTLGVSEGELIAAHVVEGSQAGEGDADATPGLQATRLQGPWPALVAALEPLGEVMALTRNASCVHEKTGTYRNTSAGGPAGREMGLVLGAEIDLRVFYRHWQHGFAVHEGSAKGVQHSLQFFDATGTAVHKVFARAGTVLPAWHRLVQQHAAPVQTPGLRVQAPPPRVADTPDAQVDRAAFHQGWASLRDTHEFFGLLKTHGLSRTQALRLAEPAYAQRVDTSTARDVLHSAADSRLAVMVFVGNPGMIQIHSGPLERVAVMGPWLNVLDPGFNLHLREDHIAQAWAVRKPTSDGLVSSLELFDAQGETIAMLFGERKPGRPELGAWRRLVEGFVHHSAWRTEGSGCTAC